MACGRSVYSSRLTSFADVEIRSGVHANIAALLEPVAQGNWRSVHRCRGCGSLWAREYPFGESQGGGPFCYYAIDTDDPQRWLDDASYLTEGLRREHEDREFYWSLGAENGPDLCKSPGCRNQHIAQSVMCRDHHFEMIKERKF